MTARGLTYICITPEGMQQLRESVDISVMPPACLCYNIFVTLCIIVYSIACNYPGITMLQVIIRYYTVAILAPWLRS